MPPRRSPRDRAIDAAIELAAARRWDDVSLADIAERSGLGLADLRREFACRSAILSAYLDRIDAAMLEAGDGEDGAGETVRDRIFDLVMRRFDRLGSDKPAIRNIVAGLARDPLAAAATMLRLAGVQRWILEAAGRPPRGIAGLVAIKGMTAGYASVFRVWLGEDDPGQPRTMAALDRMLARGERWMGRLAGPLALAETLAGLACRGRARSVAAAPGSTGDERA